MKLSKKQRNWLILIAGLAVIAYATGFIPNLMLASLSGNLDYGCSYQVTDQGNGVYRFQFSCPESTFSPGTPMEDTWPYWVKWTIYYYQGTIMKYDDVIGPKGLSKTIDLKPYVKHPDNPQYWYVDTWLEYGHENVGFGSWRESSKMIRVHVDMSAYTPPSTTTTKTTQTTTRRTTSTTRTTRTYTTTSGGKTYTRTETQTTAETEFDLSWLDEMLDTIKQWCEQYWAVFGLTGIFIAIIVVIIVIKGLD